MHFHRRNPFPARRRRTKEGKPWLFETLANLPREPERGGDFLTNIASNPLKGLDSKK
jgi:hypothetical protein